MKSDYKKDAISLRKRGLSYSEILKQVPVAKSTLSLWLGSVGLSRKQRQRLTAKKLASARRGGARKKEIRIRLTEEIEEAAKKDVKNLDNQNLWLAGTMLYWAEGSKEKEGRPGSGVQFTNSDPSMVNLFLLWLTKICKVDQNDIYFDIFIHENSKNLNRAVNYWSVITGFPKSSFPHVYLKKNKINTTRKNTGDNYYGLVKVRVRKSSGLSRRIAGWIKGVVEYFNK